MSSRVGSFLKGLHRLEKWVAAACFGGLSLLVLADIFLREGLHRSFPFGPKLAIDLMIWGGFLGASLTSARGTHLRAEAFEKIWPVSWRPAVETIGQWMTAAFCAALAYLAFSYVRETHQMGEVGVVTGIPVWISQAMIPYSFASLTLRHLAYAVMPSLRPRPGLEDLA